MRFLYDFGNSISRVVGMSFSLSTNFSLESSTTFFLTVYSALARICSISALLLPLR